MPYDELEALRGTGLILSDKFDHRQYKLKSLAVAEVFDGKRRVRIHDCGSYLEFAVDAHDNRRLIMATFCKDRMCPTCQKRRSMLIFNQLLSVAQKFKENHPNSKFLFLTLTVPNSPIEELPGSLDLIIKSHKRLFQRACVKKGVKGWFRSLEVTYNKDRDDYHPHFHCVLGVGPGYFSKYYIRQHDWLELWRQATRIDTITQVDIRRAKPNKRKKTQSDVACAAEAAKYATKPSDYIKEVDKDFYIADSKVVNELAKALKGRRLAGYGGEFKTIASQLKLQSADSDSVDLVHVDGDDKAIDAVRREIYTWHMGVRNYVN